jgi:hypothetical protein
MIHCEAPKKESNAWNHPPPPAFQDGENARRPDDPHTATPSPSPRRGRCHDSVTAMRKFRLLRRRRMEPDRRSSIDARTRIASREGAMQSELALIWANLAFAATTLGVFATAVWVAL